jgi:hypothetical protein
MKLSGSSSLMGLFLLCGALSMSSPIKAQSEEKDDKIIADAKEAKAAFIKADGLMQSLFYNSYGYVIFPNVGKGAIGIGGCSRQRCRFSKR